MTPIALGLLCAGYILGLLLTALPGEVAHLPIGVIAALSLGAVAAVLLPRLWRTGPRSRGWLAAGLVGCVAALYFQMRLPQPSQIDVSHLLAENLSSVQVQGAIDSTPRLTRSQRIQFWLRANQVVRDEQTETVAGKLYVTVPLLQGTGLYPGQIVSVTGFLYDPKSAANPGGFDFQAYLKQEGGFAGLSGRSIAPQADSPPPPLLWLVRQRILRSQVQGLGVPAGPLVSAMVMGRNGVDLPTALQDKFNQVGLAHALAASGFQVSLLIGMIVTLTQRLPRLARWSLGTGVVLAYIGLTGIQPAVLRAGIMGIAALLALTSNRKIRPLASLLLAATSLLLWNPLWIWDLGFQFSFLATLGLLVTAQPLSQRLDWLPTPIAATVAVPIAAYVWTLPLQLYVFGIVSPYSILINVLATPLIVVLSIGGMMSAMLALVHPTLGSITAMLLHYPAQALLHWVAWGDRLPGNTYALGTATVLQVMILYGLWGWLSWHYAQPNRPRSLRLLWATAALSISLIVLPMWYLHSHLTQISVLATAGMPVVVVQTPGQVVLINSGSETEVRYTVQPFLRQAGINRIDRAIALNDRSSWEQLRQTNGIAMLYQVGTARISANTQPLRENQTLKLGTLTLHLIRSNPAILEMQLGDRRWLLLDQQLATQQAALSRLPRASVLWWSGQNLPEMFDQIQPQVAIAPQIAPTAAADFQRRGTVTFATGQSGAIAWRPKREFTAMLTAE